MLTRPDCCRSLWFDAWTLGGVFFYLLVGLSTSASAQDVAAAPPSAQPSSSSKLQTFKKPDAPRAGMPVVASQPFWQDLTPIQQASLKPLAASWDTLPSFRKKKWMAIAANFSGLNPIEQAKLHSRMTEWVALSQQQRTQARMNFAESKQLTPSEKTATWQAYQALSPEEKQRLATISPPKPTGVTATSKPTPPSKLVKLPIKQPTNTPAAKVVTPEQVRQGALGSRALSPQPALVSEPESVAPQKN